jgi:c-di-GMP-binding flagellar brake protein YcgR
MARKFPPAVARAEVAHTSAPIVPRRYARVAVELPVQYAVEGRLDWQTSVIDDLGGGGVRLQTVEDVAAGTVVALRFDIDGTAIRATARVAMSLFDKSRARFVHGVAFTTIDPNDQQRIIERVVELGGRE